VDEESSAIFDKFQEVVDKAESKKKRETDAMREERKRNRKELGQPE
jgi:hypothetical protein